MIRSEYSVTNLVKNLINPTGYSIAGPANANQQKKQTTFIF